MLRRHVPFLLVVLILMPAAIAGAQSKLQLTVHTGRGVNGYDVNSTMISGEKDMLVIDPQFSLSASTGGRDPGSGCIRLIIWERRGGDSNPRHRFCQCNCLAGSPVRPLQHLSVT